MGSTRPVPTLRDAVLRTAPQGEAVRWAGLWSSLGKIELLGAGVARAAQRPVVAEGGGHVAEPGVGDDHALHHRREPDRADLEDVVGPDAIEFLAELDLLVRRHGARLVDDFDDPL